MTIEIGLLAGPAAADAVFEVVERKGLGHPDTICDALAEAVSLRLSRYYLERFGLIYILMIREHYASPVSATRTTDGRTNRARSAGDEYCLPAKRLCLLGANE